MFQQPPGNFSWGRGFGPGGPPIRKNTKEDKTIRYLLREYELHIITIYNRKNITYRSTFVTVNFKINI